MRVRFLLGPAGCGKTFRCVSEIQSSLLDSPEGEKLIFVVPKQATYQIERQVLAGPGLSGFTRLQVVSFEKAAEIILEELQVPPQRLLSEEGRVMALRGLLSKNRGSLKLFHGSSRLPGFAQELSSLLSELQHHQLSSLRLETLARQMRDSFQLDYKLHDLSVLLNAYVVWLRENNLQDGQTLLDTATAALTKEWATRKTRMAGVWSGQASSRDTPGSNEIVGHASPTYPGLQVEGLWLDGFAEITPQELDFLAALLPFCQRATLAFCCEPHPKKSNSDFSIWSTIDRTCRKFLQRLAGMADCAIVIDSLKRVPRHGRFAGRRVLQHLEEFWADPKVYQAFDLESDENIHGDLFPGSAHTPESESSKATFDADELRRSIRIVRCPEPESEVIAAAKEIRAFVRQGGRYREAALLCRKLEGFDELVRRIFSRYEIPCFLDRREPVSQHPLAELTCLALRTVVFGWKYDDWFGALKTGLMGVDETKIDHLENEALARGWEGKAWEHPLPVSGNLELVKWLEPLRSEITNLMGRLEERMLHGRIPQCSGAQLSVAVRGLWSDLRIEEQLRSWSLASGDVTHETVWEEMCSWLDSFELAFSNETQHWPDWLVILEAGLEGLTVGVIPPVLDQVLVGTVDRSRNPDLKLGIVMGLNESMFPAVAEPSPILSDADREALENQQVFLSPHSWQLLALERYYGYIACTRARQRLVLTYSMQDGEGRALNPSPFLDHIKRLFPVLESEDFSPSSWLESEHACELIVPMLQSQIPDDAGLEMLPVFTSVLEPVRQIREPDPKENLSSSMAREVYGPILESSVSRLEDFAACPFKFFVMSGLKAEERKRFELDEREQGSFQHELLAQFHNQLAGKPWRELTPAEAREQIQRVASELAPEYREGLLHAGEQGRFTARYLTQLIQDLIETIIEWMGNYSFDPKKAELPFGMGEGSLPACELRLADGSRMALRGRIDRIDLYPDPITGNAHCVVIDYKSREKRLDQILLENGVQLQLMTYLNVLRRLEDADATFGAQKLIPVGAFYVNLSGSYARGSFRNQVLDNQKDARLRAHQHAGRFDLEMLPILDHGKGGTGSSGQFNVRLNKDGQLRKGCRDPLSSSDFARLLESTEAILKRMGQNILDGVTLVDPYRKGNTTACDQCDFQTVCRIDRSTHRYRILRSSPAEDTGAPEDDLAGG